MRKIIFLLFALILFNTSFMQAQKLKGSKNVITEERAVEAFYAVIVKNDINVILEEAENNLVKVETDDNLLSAVETRVMDGTLEIYLSKEIRSKKKLNVYVSLSKDWQYLEVLDKAEVKSSTEMHIKDLEIVTKDNTDLEISLAGDNVYFQGSGRSKSKLTLDLENNIKVHLSENANLNLSVEAKKMTSELTDSTDLFVKGNCNELIHKAENSSHLKAKDLMLNYADIDITDRCEAHVNIDSEVILKLSQLSKLFLYNNPKIFLDTFIDKASLFKK